MSDPKLLFQIAEQCKVVSSLAESISKVHKDYEEIYRTNPGGSAEKFAFIVGPRTAAFMEKLGNMLNGMDAITEEDDWMKPIFEEAHRLYPNAGLN